VLLADDHEAILAKEAAVLGGEFQVVGSVGDGAALLVVAGELKPDVIVLDITMPKLHGFEAARQLRLSMPDAKLVFLTVHDDADFARAAFAAGAIGYAVKSRIATDLLPAVRAALAGRRYLSRTMHLEQVAE
jgi:DNA-binding NarL/FixJ family response regulator